ncbi:MAG TPA: 4Fe-4S binding protein [Syntrophales bacterium]|nr:4Fe-4S binding protein [Syntrophales bacterium]
MTRKIRIATQGIFLFMFLWLFLQTEAKGANELGYPVKIFLDADPLIFITTILSSREWYQTFYLAIVVAVATVVLGRVFCGWICPLGTLNNMISAIRARSRKAVAAGWFRLKYYILIFLVVSSLLSLQLTGIVDPISLLIRSFSIAVYPLVSYATNATFDAFYNTNVSSVVAVSEFFYSGLKKIFLPFQQPFYLESAFVGFLFLLIMGMNLVERRFWCRYLCPLGALLGTLSRYSILKRTVSEGCNSCGACEAVCQGSASPGKKDGWKDTECLYCMNCDDLCNQNAVNFGFQKKTESPGLDLDKRRVVGSILTGIVAVPLLRVTPIARAGVADSKLIRPPGSLDEKEFLRRCVKCGECMKVCITNGLQPTFLEAGLEGIWSPILVPRIGYCEYRCTLCGQVCPTGAIRKLELPEKNKIKIGLAMIDKGRCLPHAHATPCIVCEEVCPTPKKAIWFEETKVKNREGKERILKLPRVDLDLCIGCGVCEAKCPVLGRPAIYVTSIGESRSKENQLLLP